MTLVRDATPTDYDAYVQLARELRVDDPVPSLERFVADLLPRMMIAADEAGVIGYSLVEEMADVGYIRNIVSTPSRRRTGVGGALMEAMRVRFRARGATSWCLNVMPDNAPAIGLYERFGLRTAYRSTILRLPASVTLPPSTSRTLVPAFAEHDAAVEAKFRLLPGQLASARAKSGRHVLQLDYDGIFVYMPGVPGAFPFRLVAPELAATAIALLRTYVPITAPFMQVGVEDDDALAAEVKRLGAYVERELLHLRGAL